MGILMWGGGGGGFKDNQFNAYSSIYIFTQFDTWYGLVALNFMMSQFLVFFLLKRPCSHHISIIYYYHNTKSQHIIHHLKLLSISWHYYPSVDIIIHQFDIIIHQLTLLSISWHYYPSVDIIIHQLTLLDPR